MITDSDLQLIVDFMVPWDEIHKKSASNPVFSLPPRKIAEVIASAIDDEEQAQDRNPQVAEAITRLRKGDADTYIAGKLGYT